MCKYCTHLIIISSIGEVDPAFVKRKPDNTKLTMKYANIYTSVPPVAATASNIVDTINATHTAVTIPGKIPAPILNNNVGNIIVNADAKVPIVTTCDCGIIV